jgi:hypothetical protein
MSVSKQKIDSELRALNVDRRTLIGKMHGSGEREKLMKKLAHIDVKIAELEISRCSLDEDDADAKRVEPDYSASEEKDLYDSRCCGGTMSSSSRSRPTYAPTYAVMGRTTGDGFGCGCSLSPPPCPRLSHDSAHDVDGMAFMTDDEIVEQFNALEKIAMERFKAEQDKLMRTEGTTAKEQERILSQFKSSGTSSALPSRWVHGVPAPQLARRAVMSRR